MGYRTVFVWTFVMLGFGLLHILAAMNLGVAGEGFRLVGGAYIVMSAVGVPVAAALKRQDARLEALEQALREARTTQPQ